MNRDILIYVILASLNFYPIIYSGISSNNRYSIDGTIRGINQLISYEINITIIIISMIIINKQYNFIDIMNNQIDTSNIYILPFILIFFISVLAESNRIPFDLLESENEIVGGRITEYSSIEFTFIYLSEYLTIMINSSIFQFFFLGFLSPFFFLLFLISRALLPRYTYNDIISLN